MEVRDRNRDRNYKSSPRADSFVDTISDDAMDADALNIDAHHEDGDVEMNDDDDDAIINCICGYGKGYDDDDATSCAKCETWQHNLCYFTILGRKIPSDGDHFLCADCGPSHEIDRHLATISMRKKLNRLQRIADQIAELKCELLVREEELEDLDCEIACVESEWYTKGPALASRDPTLAWDVLDEWREEHELICREVERTLDERDAVRWRVAELEDDQARVRRNEPTIAEEQVAWAAKLKHAPRLWTTAGSLGNRGCHPYTLPMALKLSTRTEGSARENKRKKKRVYR